MDRSTEHKGLELLPYPVAAGTAMDMGKMIALNAAGYAIPAANTTGLRVVGCSDEAVDNIRGANGEKSILVRSRKAFLYDNDGANPITQKEVGSLVQVIDDHTIGSETSGNVNAGICVGLDADGVWVKH